MDRVATTAVFSLFPNGFFLLCDHGLDFYYPLHVFLFRITPKGPFS